MSEFPDPRIEPLARALAVADGLDPESRASGGPNDFALRRSEFNGYALAVSGPVWKTYARQAILMITAHDFLNA